MGITNNLPTPVAEWLEKQFPVQALGYINKLVGVCRAANSDEVERIIDIAHGDQCNKPFDVHTLWPLETHDGDICTSHEDEPAFLLCKLGATYKLLFIDIDDDNPHTLRVINYKKFKGLTNVNG